MAAATSGSASNRESLKKPAACSVVSGETGEIARIDTFPEEAPVLGLRYNASYHMSGAVVSRLPDIGFRACQATATGRLATVRQTDDSPSTKLEVPHDRPFMTEPISAFLNCTKFYWR